MTAEIEAKRAEIKQAFAQWRALPRSTRSEVVEAARRGERHQNADALRTGERYAQAFYERQDLRTKGSRSPWVIIAMFFALMLALTPSWQQMATEVLVALIVGAVLAMIVIVAVNLRQERETKALRELPR